MAVAAACSSTKDAALFQTLTETCSASPATPVPPDGGDRISPADRQAVDAALTRLDEIGEAKVKGKDTCTEFVQLFTRRSRALAVLHLHAAAVSPASAPPTITSPPPPLLPPPSRPPPVPQAERPLEDPLVFGNYVVDYVSAGPSQVSCCLAC